MNKKVGVIAIVAIGLLAAAAYGWSIYRDGQQSPLTLYGNVDIRTVNLNFRASGRLASLEVDEGDAIKAGQLVAILDDTPYKNAVLEAQANVNAVKAQLDLLLAGTREEEIAQARSAVSQAQATYDYAQTFYKRQQELWQTKAVSANALDDARTSRDQAMAQLASAKDKLTQYLNGSRPQEIQQAQAKLQQAEAALAQASLNLEDTRLHAPSPGTILTRAVEPGSMLTASTTVVTLSLTRPVWIRAYVSETHLSNAVPGTKVNIYTDGRPDKPYHGTIGFVSPTAEFTPKTVQTPELRTALVYRLRIVVTDPDDGLRQGMPVTITFPATFPAQ